MYLPGREFSRMVAVKVLAWMGDNGYPSLIPALSMQPSGERVLVGRIGQRSVPVPPAGIQAATNILTFEAISYQAKVRWDISGKFGTLLVEEVYAGGPPLPGGRVA